jgi:nicotinic acid mononucleotide adenylyltransferase
VRIGVYPGSFSPPTIAHLAVARAACEQGGLDYVELVVSTSALGKPVSSPCAEHRVGLLAELRTTFPWLRARTSELQLVADLARDYDAVVLGADKWAQLQEPHWYPTAAARDEALAALPPVLVAPRPPYSLPSDRRVTSLEIDSVLGDVSSSAVRAGRQAWMLPEAAMFDRRTGAWSDPDRYSTWCSRDMAGRTIRARRSD